MTSSATGSKRLAQAVVTGNLAEGDLLNGRAGSSEFAVGGPDGRGHTMEGANPYDLLSASLAACTAMSIRLHARQKKYPLSHVEVEVSFHHGDDKTRYAFERAISLKGDLDEKQREQLMLAAETCPVGRTLGLSADIRTRPAEAAALASTAAADYDDDLENWSTVNIDPD